MATEFYKETTKRDGLVSLTTFFGGEKDGRCLSALVCGDYDGAPAELTESEVKELRDQLNDWLARKNLGS